MKARERWKSAKEAAKKHTSGLQAQISRKFSRIKSVKHPEHSRIEVDDDRSGALSNFLRFVQII